MRGMRTGRVVAAAALAVSLGAVLAVTPASATTKRVKATCTVLTGNAKKTADKLSSCTPAADNGGTANGIMKAGKTGTSGTAVLTWINKHGVTKLTYNATVVTPEKCGTSVVKGKKVNNIEATVSGTVTSSTGTAAKDIKVGDSISATICVNAATSAESLLKGTKFVL